MSDVKTKKYNFADWPMLFLLWSIQGSIAFLWLLLLPTDTTNEVAFGFSAARLALLGSACLITCGSITLLVQSRKHLSQQNWLNVSRNSTVWDLIYLLSIAVSLLSPLVILVLYNLQDNPANSSYASRLSPFAFWGMASGLELAILLAIKREGKFPIVFEAIKPQLRITVV